MKRLNAVLLTLFLSLVTSYALAHGDEHESKGPVKKEQTDWGIADNAKAAKRTLNIKMLDTMRFSPYKFEIKKGETIKFVIKNEGQMLHEFVLGTQKVLDEHAALMVKFPNMEHSEPYMAHVPAGTSKELVWTFNRAGTVDFACLIAGHYQAGMKGQIKVVAK
ncbi:MAG: plastocyanin [Rhodocyclales bacterium]|nr:plastocyanin [Rhodocyclales bacterium]